MIGLSNKQIETGAGEEQILLSASELKKYYGSGDGQVRALDGVSMDVHTGELLIILGSSGSGKTTLLNVLGGMISPDEGTLFYRGRDISRMDDKALTDYRRQHVGFVFQSFNLIQELSVWENIALTANFASEEAAQKTREQVITEALELTDLTGKADAFPSQLSGGQQQRVSIARALVKGTDLLLCDEPTGALDYETGRQIIVRLEELCRVHGRTVVIVTHNREIARIGDRIITLRTGKILSEIVNETPASAREIEW